MKNKLIITIALAAFAGLAAATPQSFDFKDPKGVNNAGYKLDAPLEAIIGSASGVSGTVEFDAENPGATKGKIFIATDSLTVPNPMMKEHLHGPMWMNTAMYKEITFEVRSLENVKTDGNLTTADAVGDFSAHGVTKKMSVPVKITYLKDKLGQRVPKLEGDLLVIRSAFKIKRSDYGINPGAPEDKVSDEIEITLSIAGAAPRK